MRSCPVCSQNKFNKIAELNYALFDDLQLSGNMELVSCGNCHAYYNRTELQESDFAQYYLKNQYYLDCRTAGSGGSSAKDTKRYSQIYKHIKRYLTIPSPTVLDFGCGKGGMLSWLKNNTRAQLVGIEASENCRKFAEGTLSVPVVHSLHEVNKKFDVIILSHVLEHIYSPRELIQSLKKFTDRKTIFYIEVPLADAYIGKTIRWQELYFEHINHFTANSLNNLMVSCGLQIVEYDQKYFYEDDTSSSVCHNYLAVIHSDDTDNSICIPSEPKINSHVFPTNKIIDKVLTANQPISIWGISQYTQLILGSYPQLIAKIKYLFDSSPAKIGRSIQGIKVIPADKLSILTNKDTLLYPLSPYCEEMTDILKKIGFSGKAIRF